jgi:type 1 glutamine amidotransferase
MDVFACRRLGLRLSEVVGYYINGREECHPLAASGGRHREAFGGPIPARDAPIEQLRESSLSRTFSNLTLAKLDTNEPKKVLIFTKMDDYVHGSTAAAAAWIKTTVEEMGMTGVVSDDSSLLETGSPHVFDLIVLVNNSGQIFDPKKEALTKHIQEGRGVMGVHAALASFLDGKDASGATLMTPTTTIIEDVFKTHFRNHPPEQTGKVSLVPQAAAALGIANVPMTFDHTDEFFNYTKNPNKEVTVVATVDESTYDGGLMGESHPVVWHHTMGDNEAPIFYCALGHFASFYNGLGSPHVSSFLKAGLRYCAKI